ncbi:MAG: T9SS type A sorting domain-containing protein [Bacteroidota bacterium]
MSRLLSVVMLLAVLPIVSLSQEYAWLRDLGDDVQILHINEASNGSILVGGEFESIAFLDSIYQADLGGTDIFVAAYDLEGNEEWIKVIKGVADFEFSEEAEVHFTAMDLDGQGNIYLLGEVNGRPISIDGSIYLAGTAGLAGGSFVIKLSQEGTLTRFMDDFSFEQLDENLSGDITFSDLTISTVGELYLAVALDGDWNLAGTTYFSTRNSRSRKVHDPLILKYASSGSLDWVQQGKSQWNEARSSLQLALDLKENIIMAGTFSTENATELGLLFTSLGRLPSGQSGDGVFAVKFSAEGVPLWSRLFADDNESSFNDEEEDLKDLVVDGSDIFLSINFSEEIILGSDTVQNPGPNRGNFPFDGNVVVKLDELGNPVWHKVFSSPIANAQLAVNPVSQVVTILGAYEEVFFPTENIRLVDNRSDYFLADLDSTGTLLRIDTTEYTPSNRDVAEGRHPIQYFSGGSMVASLQFDGGGLVQIGDLSVSDPTSILLRRNGIAAGIPFTVDLGPDRGQCQGMVTLDAGVGAEFYIWSNGATSQIIEVSTSGLYSVEATNFDGITASDEVQVTIDQPYEFSFPDSVSAVDEVELFGPFGNITYLWSTGETTQNIVVSTSGEYTLTVFTPFGCETSDTITVVLQELDIFRGGIGDGDSHAFFENQEGAFYLGGLGDGYSQTSSILEQGFFDGSVGDGYSEASLANSQGFFRGSLGDGTAQAFLSNGVSFFGGSEGDGYGAGLLANKNAFFAGSSGDGYSATESKGLAGFFRGGVGDGHASATFVKRVLGSIQDGKIIEGLQIYPNPTTGPVTISVPEFTASAQLTLWNLKGQKIKSIEITKALSSDIKWNLAAVPPGIYLVSWADESGRKEYGKLIKQ